MTEILLALILAVLLFGSGAVLGGLGWLLAVVGAIIVLVMLCRWIGDGLEALKVEFEDQKQKGTLYSSVLGFVGFVGNCAVAGLAYLLAERGGQNRLDFEQVPLWWVPIVLFGLSFPLGWLEKAVRRRAAAKKGSS
jgi:hypothetical protein